MTSDGFLPDTGDTMLVFIALFACGSNEPDCTLGFVPNPDGNCYEDTSDDPVPPSWDDAIEFAYDHMPDCDVDSGNGELDFEAGCASGACVGMTRTEFEDLLGEPDEVVTTSNSWAIMYWWYIGTQAWFYDPQNTDVVEADAVSRGIQITPGYVDGTDEGLSSEVSLRCFVDVLGDPDEITFQDLEGWDVTSLQYGDHLTVWDYLDRNDVGHDGRADYIYMD